ncbi:RNA 2'-phosphotransferase [Hymenobacter weizhouensis]|uniref:RNA 2'-phosphotransferase n=1 Tax=Hymenobacter sp. YIM 151500-1 TaxID=2987689 RepID=UPI002226B157|nr:RNA 2'-phosphotransferase [Hymenobacter sp. YIM 151500-1]UYZ64083.1 RNA 2'-phosphotransferase [Hymenobacter sp. YIM 151500-1]
MSNSHIVRLSKFLSKHLRHAPQALGLTLELGGWVGVEELLAAANRAGVTLDRAMLDEVVASNDKQRFAFDADGTQIRAQQGHSVAVELDLAPAVPPAVLYHGTVATVLSAIQREGLQPMRRHHVHLSADEATARRVGSRRGQPVVLTVDAAGLHAAGGVFYQSGNGVWLTEHVPPAFLQLPLPGRSSGPVG